MNGVREYYFGYSRFLSYCIKERGLYGDFQTSVSILVEMQPTTWTWMEPSALSDDFQIIRRGRSPLTVII